MSDKHTEMEKPLMEGGHSVEDYTTECPFVKEQESFSFLKELSEARMTRNESNTRVLTYTDCCERAYLSMLILQLMRYYPKYEGISAAYAKRTDDPEFKMFKSFKTDLYNFIYFITGDSRAFKKLKDPESALRLSQRTFFPRLHFNRFISRLKNASAPKRNDQEALLKIESGLRITNSDYKSIRRALFSWDKLDRTQRKNVTTRLLFAARAKLRNSDLIDDLEALAASKDLENNTLPDTEPKVSVPDVTVTAQDMNLYRFLVGTDNMVMAKKFLELAKDGKSIPRQFVAAYLPAIEAIDDIVKAGPGYVQMLRQLQNRAKKSYKK